MEARTIECKRTTCNMKATSCYGLGLDAACPANKRLIGDPFTYANEKLGVLMNGLFVPYAYKCNGFKAELVLDADGHAVGLTDRTTDHGCCNRTYKWGAPLVTATATKVTSI